MRNLLCRVCAGPAGRDERGVLYLTDDRRGDWPDWPKRLLITHPQLCLPCAARAVRACPHLLSGHVAPRSTASEICAIHGRPYRPGPLLPVPGEKAIVPYDDPAIRYVPAGQLVRSLHGCTLLDFKGWTRARSPPPPFRGGDLRDEDAMKSGTLQPAVGWSVPMSTGWRRVSP
ncbi:hypothetical protein [Streptomyces sp. NPDC005266]